MSKESVRAQLLEGFARVDSTGARNCHLTRNEFARLCSLLDSKLTEDKVQASLEAVGYSSGTDQLYPDDLVNWMFDGTPIPAKATASTAVAPAKAKAQVRPSTATLRQEAKQILLGAADNGSLESALKSTSTTKERPLSATLLSAAVGAASMEQEANSEEPFQLVEQFQFVQEVDIEEVKLRAQRALASAMALDTDIEEVKLKAQRALASAMELDAVPDANALRQQAKKVLLGAADNGSLASALKSTSTTQDAVPDADALRQQVKGVLLGGLDNGSLASALKSTSTTQGAVKPKPVPGAPDARAIPHDAWAVLHGRFQTNATAVVHPAAEIAHAAAELQRGNMAPATQTIASVFASSTGSASGSPINGDKLRNVLASLGKSADGKPVFTEDELSRLLGRCRPAADGSIDMNEFLSKLAPAGN